ncbi:MULTISPECIES: YcjX family protein [unclassified Xanthobacter]|uniref:YcjX family protein n=1 Tax=unclassified Xanthobacter TaxID=2623496 RepID=UPI001EDD8ECC|nr:MULTISPECIES: YcjX family protein [unclassified Xanthobacter]
MAPAERMIGLTGALDEARIAWLTLADRVEGLAHPTLRLGVTGLSRAGKTIFTTALVHALQRGGRMPVFEAMQSGRIARAELEPQPDDAVPRFAYEEHLATLAEARAWPSSTTRVSELRLAVRYATARGSLRTLTLDLVDYPGEWLLDLPLLAMSYADFARQSLELARAPARARVASPYLAAVAAHGADGPADEAHARELAALFTAYLSACRTEQVAMSLLPPGRFLMPGDLEGSPALTFAPLDPPDGAPRPGSLGAMMERRFEAYKNAVVRPFFRNHFARLDRQIVLVDALSALNAGPAALADLERALDGILAAFRTGRNSLLSTLFRPRIDKVLFAATKADHLHHTSHDRLEAILARLVERARGRAKEHGAALDVVALAAIRATREARVRRDGLDLAAIVGTPEKGQEAGGHRFDGEEEVAVFPGELPADPDSFFDPAGTGFRGLATGDVNDADFRFLKFRPPAGIGGKAPIPHIRLDRALEFLLGDRLV